MMRNPFSHVIGNDQVTGALRIAIEAARRENRLPGHILLSGPAGTGKTKFSEMIAESLGSALRRVHAPGISRRNSNDLTTALITLDAGSVLFIDEIHALPKESMEGLYEAMEQKQVSLTAPTGDGRVKVITIGLNDFVLVGATTDPGKLTEPLMSRFYRHLRLTDYSTEELARILKQYLDNTPSESASCSFTYNDLENIARRSRGRARNALSLLHVCRDHLIAGGHIADAFAESGIGSCGQTSDDEAYVEVLRTTFDGGPAGIESIVAASGLKRETIERTIEPFLILNGIIRRTSRGRILTGAFPS